MDDDELLQALVDELTDESEMDDESQQAKTAQFKLHMQKGESEDQTNARAALTPEYHAANSIFHLNQISPFGDVDLTELANRLEYQIRQLKDGDLAQAESMLASQAHTLDSLFHNLLKRSALNIRNDFNVVEKLMKLAMKAQSQCRTTWESLASMKRPPELIRQTNIAHGHQQVNNFPEKGKAPNELLEKTDGMDTGTPQEAIRGDQDMATVAAKHRAKDK